MQKGNGLVWILGGVFAALFVLVKVIPFPIFALIVLGGVGVAILWDRRRMAKRPPPKTIAARNSDRTRPLVKNLEVRTQMEVRRENGVNIITVELTNSGLKPLGPLPMELSIIYSNFLGTPARGGNNVDGFRLLPRPEPVTLAPKETRRVDVYRSDAPARPSADGKHLESTLAVMNELREATDLVKFIAEDDRDVFHLTLRVADHSHFSSLKPETIKRAFQ